jgi:autotransporter-associated beta strand protein
MLNLRFRAGLRLVLSGIACAGLVAGPLAWRAMADRSVDFGASDNLAAQGLPPVDQPLVQVALYTHPTTNDGTFVGPSTSNSFILDSGASTILAAASGTNDLTSSPLFQTVADYNEQGVAGFSPTRVSASYRLDYAGTDGIPSSVYSTRILSSSDLDLDSFDGIAGTPVMVGHGTTVDMTTLPTDFQMSVRFWNTSTMPTSNGHRYDVPLQMVNFPLSGQVKPTDPLPTSAPLSEAAVKLTNGTHKVESHFIIDTGAQISIISSATAAALGINPNDPNQVVTTLQVGGIGGTVNMPVVNTNAFAIHTRQGTDLKWSDLNVGVLDVDPQIAGVIGIDVLSNGWLDALFGTGNGDLSKFHFDFRNSANMTGDLLLDVDPSHDMVTSSDGSTSWDVNGSGSYGNVTMWNSVTTLPNGAGVSATFGNGLVNTVSAQTVTVNIDAPYVLGSIAFTNSLGTSYILANSGGSITLDNNGNGALVSVAPGVTAPQQIQANIILADNATFDVAGGSSLVVTGGISETGASRGITVTGTGLLTLGAANSFTGGTTVNSGTLTTTADGALGSGPLAVNADDRGVSVVNLGSNEMVGGLSGTLAGTGTARVNIAAGKTLSVSQSVDSVFAGNISLASGATAGSGGSLTKSGGAALEIDGAPSLGNNSKINVAVGTLRFNLTPSSSGTVAIGTGVTATISNSAVLELAGTVSALSTGGGVPAPAGRVHVINNCSTPAGLLISGTNQQVGGIDGTGTTQVNAGSDLTADHIVQSALVIGGTASSHGVVTIAASDQTGKPLGLSQSSGLGIAGSLTPSGPFGDAPFTASGLLPVGAEGFSGDPIPAGQLSGNPKGGSGTSPVPEPATWLLSAVAVLIAGLVRAIWIWKAD